MSAEMMGAEFDRPVAVVTGACKALAAKDYYGAAAPQSKFNGQEISCES